MIQAIILAIALSGPPQPQCNLIIGGHPGDYRFQRAVSDAKYDGWLVSNFKIWQVETDFRPPRWKTSRSTVWQEWPENKAMPRGPFETRGMCWPMIRKELTQHIYNMSEEGALSWKEREPDESQRAPAPPTEFEEK